jgi:hypothetical protein
VGTLMDLVAGDAREILLAIGVDDWAGLSDRGRFPGYLSLGGGMDPSWLDLFARAVRDTAGSDAPMPFSEATCPLESPAQLQLANLGDRTIEVVDRHWIDEIASLPDRLVGRVAARWIELVDLEECRVEADEKPMFRQVAGELVEFCRLARDAEDVLFAWSI